MQESFLEVGTPGDPKGWRKVVPVSVVGLRSRSQPLELSDRIGAPIGMEEVIRPGAAKYIVVAERHRVRRVLGVVGPLDLIAKAQIDSDIGTETPGILSEHTRCLLSRSLNEITLQGIVSLFISNRRSAQGGDSTDERGIDGPGLTKLGSTGAGDIGGRADRSYRVAGAEHVRGRLVDAEAYALNQVVGRRLSEEIASRKVSAKGEGMITPCPGKSIADRLD